MGIVAFVQLVVAGLALAMRMEATREVKVVEKVVTQIVAAPKPEPIAAPRVEVAPDPLPDLPAVVSVPLPPPRNLETPAIADPVTEKLVKEARNARIKILKEMLKADWKEEEIEGYHCDKCPARTLAKRKMAFTPMIILVDYKLHK
jgi:hypothetical protein